ncbi:MAG: tetratricopeptide repeat protein [Pyrinomonadaceae bacterium]
MFGKNLIKIWERNLKIAAIAFSIVLTLAVANYAQNINDDLKPKETNTKTNTKPKPPVKATPKVSKPTKRSVSRPNNTKSKSSVNSGDNSSETPDQIINRFMNFRQTASVTDKDWTSVINQTQKSIKTNPNNVTANAQMLIAQGQIAYNQRDYVTAFARFKSASQMLPTSSLPQYCLGQAYLANGQAEAAENAFKQAIEQNKDFALAYKGIGDALAAQGKKKDAAKYTKKATEVAVRQGSYVP